MVEEKETEVLDDLFVKLQGVTATVPSSSNTQEPATTCDSNFTNNGAVITSPLPSSIAGAGNSVVEQPTNCISTQDQHSSNSVTSSPVKSQPQNHANTMVPESGEQATANPPDQSTRQQVVEDVTTTQPQAQPKDPNLMPSTAATTAES